MKEDDSKKDINIKRLFKNPKIMAVLLKAVVEEYQDVSIEDIINKYLVDVSDQNNPIIKALDKEFGGFQN